MSNKFKRSRDSLAGCICIALSLNSNTVIAETADQYFDQGVRAAKRDRPKAALKAFQQAGAAGLDSPGLHYNLGVVYYHLAQYGNAAEQFKLLTDNAEYAAVAFYNLGLINLKLGHDRTAKEHFLKAYSDANDDNLKNLSLRALQRLDVKPPSRPSLFTGWSGLVTLNAGYDDNVSLIDEDISQANGIADYHLEAFAATNRMLWGNDENGIHFGANVDVLKQQKEHDYDYSQWHLALMHRGMFARWQTRARAGVDQTRFGNADFQQLLNLELRGRRELSKKKGVELRYKYLDIQDRSPGDRYEYLAGNRQQLRLRITDKRKTVRVKYSYELQLNDRNDFSARYSTTAGTITTLTTQTRSYSPIRHTAQVSAEVPWGKLLTLNLEAQYRYSHYSDPDTQIDTNIATGEITNSYSFKRKDQRYGLNISLGYNVTPRMELFADYGFTKNNSNRDGSDYRRRLIRAGVTWFY